MAVANTTVLQVQQVTVIPEDDESSAKNWIKENPVVVAIIAVAILFLIIVGIFYCIRRKRKASASKEVNINETETENQPTQQPVVAPASFDDHSPTENNVFPETFMIIQSPNLHGRLHQKRKSTLAVPPAFSVSNSHRKSAPNAPLQLRHSVVGWTRWSNAGLEIHTSPPPEMRENPMPKGYARKKRQSTPGIMMAVPMVYRSNRRASHVPQHSQAVHVSEYSTPPPKQRPSTP